MRRFLEKPHVSDLLHVGALWVAFLVLTNILGEASIQEMRVVPESRWRYDQIHTQHRWVRWDANWYLRIATEGYRYDPTSKEPSSVGFFPLYPLLIRGVAAISPLDPTGAALLISRLALLASMWILVAAARGRGLGEDRFLPVIALLFFPGAYILGAVYAESLFLLLTLGAFLLAEKRKELLAAALAFAAGATRIHGLVLAPSLLLLGILRFRTERRPAALLPGIAALLGTSSYFLFTSIEYGDFLLYFHHRAAWDQELRSPVGPLADFLSKLAPLFSGGHVAIKRFAQLACLAIAIAGSFVLSKRKRWHEALLFVSLIGTNLVSGTLDGIDRYLVFCFPAFFLLAEIAKGRILWPTYLLFGAFMQAFNIFRYVTYQTPPP